jgi:hypothetical protein
VQPNRWETGRRADDLPVHRLSIAHIEVAGLVWRDGRVHGSDCRRQRGPDTLVDPALSRTERRRTSGGRSRASAHRIGDLSPDDWGNAGVRSAAESREIAEVGCNRRAPLAPRVNAPGGQDFGPDPAGATPLSARVLDSGFLLARHKRMFGQVWTWAGTRRRRGTNGGVAPAQIASQTKQALDDSRSWQTTPALR